MLSLSSLKDFSVSSRIARREIQCIKSVVGNRRDKKRVGDAGRGGGVAD